MERRMLVFLAVLAAVTCVSSRWLPTRSHDDRLDKLREMLKDLLESEIEKTYNDRRAIYKRDVAPSLTADDNLDRRIPTET